MDVHGEFDTIEPLQQTGDPYDPFALQKACLLACGIIPSDGGNLRKILTRLGGCFEMHSEVTNVPKGSGLGTSSILSTACVKAIFEFMGIPHTEADLYAHVLVMEQIMSTGGGMAGSGRRCGRGNKIYYQQTRHPSGTERGAAYSFCGDQKRTE